MGRNSKLTIGAMLMLSLSGQAVAASLEDAPALGRDAGIRGSSFAGARLRLALGGRGQEKMRAGPTFSAMQSGRSGEGYAITRFAGGVELGLTGRESKPHLSIAGYSSAPERLGASENETGRKRGRALRTVAFVVGGVLIAGVIAYGIVIHEATKNSD